MTQESLGHAVAIAILMPIAERLAYEHAQKEREEERRRQLDQELAKLPQLTRPDRPSEQAPVEYLAVAGEVVGTAFGSVIVLEIVFLVFLGPFLIGPLLYGKKFSESGYPWSLLLLAPLFLGALVGVWPVLRAATERGRRQEELQRYESAVQAADRRDAERAAIHAKFSDGGR
jgi:hypothetical protein